MDIVRKELTPDELQNPNNRYDVDCDCTQTTIDGGATWVNNPGVDPRTSTALLLPVPTTSDPQCDAATGIINNFHGSMTALLNNLSVSDNVWAGASLIITLLDFLTGIVLIIQLFIDLCALILSIGVASVESEFTDTVYDQIKCILYCDAKPDGTFDSAAFEKVQTDVQTTFGELSDVNLVFQGWLAGLGFVGLTNVGSVKRTTGDCSDCECAWCWDQDLTTSDFSMSTSGAAGWPALAQYTSGVGWQAVVNSSRGVPAELASFFGFGRLMPDARYTKIELTIDITFGDQSVFSSEYSILLGSTHLFDFGNTDQSGVLTWTGDLTTSAEQIAFGGSNTGIGYNNTGGDSGGSATLSHIHLEGIGANPFGTNNC